ncbi:MAG: isoprenylcysteine carboxylmethyltransferase family protein [Chloroflexota bacterium]
MMRLFLVLFGFAGGAALIAVGLAVSATNFLGWLVAAVGAAYGLGSAVWFAIKGVGGRVVREETGDRSFWLIIPGFVAIFFGPPLEYLYLPETLSRASAMQGIGVALLLIGVALRLWVRRALREMYTGHVQVQAEHRLVREGPYRFLRHPGYTAFVLIAAGFAVGFSSVVGLTAIPLLLLPGLIYRMNVEEELLIEQFGDGYREYASVTKRLLPGIW